MVETSLHAAAFVVVGAVIAESVDGFLWVSGCIAKREIYEQAG
jgi:hypothetical protein